MCVTYRTGYSRSQGAPRMATISKAETDEVKARHQLSAIIGRTVKLRKAGNEYVGLCPYHSEKSPSFRVNDSKGLFRSEEHTSELQSLMRISYAVFCLKKKKKKK